MPQEVIRGREPTAADYAAFDRILPELGPDAPPPVGSPEFREFRRLNAHALGSFGESQYRLLKGLRAPVDKTEQIVADLCLGRIDAETYHARLQADADRPIDSEMVNALFAAIEGRIMAYSRFYTAIEDARAARLPEEIIDAQAIAVANMTQFCRPFSIHPRHIGKVMEHVIRLRAPNPPVKVGTFTASSAIGLVFDTRNAAADAWSKCLEHENRTRLTRPRRRIERAARVFGIGCLADLPRPQELLAHLELEQAAALDALGAADGTRTQAELTGGASTQLPGNAAATGVAVEAPVATDVASFQFKEGYWRLSFRAQDGTLEVAPFPSRVGFGHIHSLLYGTEFLLGEIPPRDCDLQVTDERTLGAVRNRLGELGAAREHADPVKTEETDAEIEKLESYLAASTKPGGAIRTAPDARSRALARVRNAINDALKHVEGLAPKWVAHMRESIDYTVKPIPAYRPRCPISWT